MKQKQILAFAWMLLGSVLLSQPVYAEYSVSSNRNGCRDGDELLWVPVNWISPGGTGRSMCWKIDDPDIGVANAKQTISIKGDSVTILTTDASYYCKRTHDGLLLRGFENRTTTVDYHTMPLLIPEYMCYGDSISLFSNGSGIYCDKLYVGQVGKGYVVADAEGVIAVGDLTIPDVLRIHRHTESIQSASKQNLTIEVLTDWDIEDSINESSERIVEDRWLWYAKGCRYPILQSDRIRSVEGNEEKVIFQQSYTFLPEAQIGTLAEDKENEADRKYVNDLMCKGMKSWVENPSGELISCSAVICEDNRVVRISYEQNFNGPIFFTVSDVPGHVLGSASFIREPGSYQAELILGRKPIGNVVILSITAAGNQYTIKVNQQDK